MRNLLLFSNLCLALVLGLPATATAQAAPTLENTCETLSHLDRGHAMQLAGQALFDLIRMGVSPGSFAHPRVVSEGGSPAATNSENPAAKGIVFWIQDPIQAEAEAAGFESEPQRVEFLKLQKTLKRLALARSKEICLRIGKREGFDPIRYLELQPMAEAARQQDEARAMERLSHKSQQRLRNSSIQWTWANATSIQEVWSSLSDPSIQDIVIVAHATPEGQLIDSYGNIYPASFFRASRAPHRSLSIFSCHSEAVRRFYDLSHTPFQVVSLARESRFMGKTEVAPVAVAPRFIQTVDRKLRRLPPRATQGRREIPLCSIEAEGLLSESMGEAWGVFEEGQLVAVLGPSPSQEIDCPTPGASYGIRSLAAKPTHSVLNDPTLRVNREPIAATLVRREDGSIRIIRWTTPPSPPR